jgi:predicted GNAT family N-acyltransferase
MPTIAISELRSPAEIERAFAIRRRVFVEEQGVSEALEFDGRDGEAEHLLALLDDEPVGTLRLRLLEGGRIAKIERVAVLVQARGRRIGEALMRAALARAIALEAHETRLHAQTAAVAFYTSLGFEAHGPEFEEDGIPHVAMRLDLEGTDRQRLEAP